ncbi:uncharacterized protein LOC122525045 isoform X5 [Polistes fuscatus]|uniref:uncharacterized protein LOC122525045 isoform X5 n=1 Tax=Polistes fuscatus TaxID=30207 RepID=UPI001CA86D9F|nr:uncharacterized protein LOC122525045 isoform X5 [Polistes fuscatus]
MLEALRMLELVIPQYVVRGQNIRLECSFNLDGEILYSVKWYKDGNEFYRYVPRDMPPVLVFSLPGVSVDIHNSTERSVVLYSVNLMSSGRYRCEVSAEAPSFQTVSDHSDMMVVALPENGPVITGRPGRRRYQVSDVVRFNCTSAKSKPAAMLSWFINGEPVDPQYLRGPHITEVDREGLETAVLGLEFRLRTKHFKKGDMKIKCLATIATVYWKSNELSIEGERPLKMPVMESRETRAQGHTHAEHILASANIKSVGSSLSLLTLGLLILRTQYRTSSCFVYSQLARFLATSIWNLQNNTERLFGTVWTLAKGPETLVKLLALPRKNKCHYYYGRSFQSKTSIPFCFLLLRLPLYSIYPFLLQRSSLLYYRFENS